jgi:hypothetical protein
MHFKRAARACILFTILLTGCSTKAAIPEVTNQISPSPTTAIESLTPMPSKESEPTVSIDPKMNDSSASPTPLVSSKPLSTADPKESVAVSAAPSKSSVSASNESPKSIEQASPQPTPAPSSPQSAAPQSTANPNSRMMSMTFQALIQMDKTAGLVITKEQAAPMLTIVQEAITKGELTAEAQTKLEANLTADQKKFLVDNAAKMPQRPSAGKGQVPQGEAPQGNPGLNSKGNGGAAGNMKNSGTELLALLKSKP